MSALVRRSGAVLAALSAVLHAGSVGHAGPAAAVLMLAMVAACGYCAYELWTRDTVRGWVLVAVMNLAMIGLHLPMTGAHQHGGGAAVVGPSPQLSAMELATGVAVVEVIVAATVLFVRTRAPAYRCLSVRTVPR